MGSFFYFIIDNLVGLLVLAIIVNAVMSWLVAFDVINLRNRFVYQFARLLDAVTSPVMRPVQKIIPPLGGVDISPIIVILVLEGLRRYLLPMLFAPIIGAVG
jgi:YggT family protein